MLEIPDNPIEELVIENSELNVSINNNEVEGPDSVDETDLNRTIEELVIGEVNSELNVSEETDLNRTPNNNEDITASELGLLSKPNYIQDFRQINAQNLRSINFDDLENTVDEDWTMEQDKETSHPSSPPALMVRKPQVCPKTRSSKTSTTSLQQKVNCEKCGKLLNIKSMKAHLRLHEKKELLASGQEILPPQTKKNKRTLSTTTCQEK